MFHNLDVEMIEKKNFAVKAFWKAIFIYINNDAVETILLEKVAAKLVSKWVRKSLLRLSIVGFSANWHV